MSNLNKLKQELKKLSNSKRAKACLWFFKTGKGQYGEGQKFLGVKTEDKRKLAKQYDLTLAEIQQLLTSKIHDHRFIAVVMLANTYKKATDKTKKQIYNLYIKNTKNINNWDLVDISAPHIVGNHLLDKPKLILYKLAKSKNLWEKRIAILSTFTFIRNNQYKDTLQIAKILLNDDHDLIHKAVGWMLREVGNRDMKTEEEFLKKHVKNMPRTMLRYAIEKFPEKKRLSYLKK